MPVLLQERSDCEAYAIRFVVSAYEGVTPRAGKGVPHAQAVADVLRDAGCATEVQVVGLLHDVIEDTPTTADDVRAAFPDAISGLVVALTEDDSIEDYGERKAALRRQLAKAGQPALQVALADKVATLEHAFVTGTRTPSRRLAHYRATLHEAVQAGVAPDLCERVRRLLAGVESGQHSPPHAE